MKVVISLGGSVIVPKDINYKYLKKFAKLIKGFSKKNKVIIVCGGGSTARKYIESLIKLKAGLKAYSVVGIAATRINARLVRGVFGFRGRLPVNLKQVKYDLSKSNLVVCGALGMKKNMTSDANAAEVADLINADFFINITNVAGLYTKHPRLKGAELIKEVSFNDFLKRVEKIKFKAGQHFVLDQVAAKIIKRHKIKTFIVSSDLRNLKKVLKGKRFKGTVVQ
jgi:uridylate kinase